MFDAAEALALRQLPLGIVQADMFDAELLSQGMATGQPLVFHALPHDWRCADIELIDLECACGDLHSAEPAVTGPSVHNFVSQLYEGIFRGTGGFRCSTELLRWSGLPNRTGQVIWGHPYLFGGAIGAVTPLHRDAGDGLNVHMLGSKLWTLLSPLHASDLVRSDGHAPTGFQESSVPLQQFEGLYGRSGSFQQVVRAGEAIFIPSGWFHEVRLLEVSLSLAAPLFPMG